MADGNKTRAVEVNEWFAGFVERETKRSEGNQREIERVTRGLVRRNEAFWDLVQRVEELEARLAKLRA